MEDTACFAERLAKVLAQGGFLGLNGDLGAGKTTVARALTKSLGCSRLANSPTYAIFQVYQGPNFPVLHGDFYRLGSLAEVYDLGFEDLLAEHSSGLVLIEWAEKFPQVLPPERLDLTLVQGEDEFHRNVTLSGQGDLWTRACEIFGQGRA